MSTNSAIGIVYKGKIKAIYAHWDGYVDGVGKTLVENYDLAKAELLMREGNCSVLGSEVGVKHPFDSYRLTEAEKVVYEGMSVFYGRDRDEEDQDSQMFDNAEDFLEGFGGEYWYLLGTDGVWYFSKGDMNWKPVSENLGVGA